MYTCLNFDKADKPERNEQVSNILGFDLNHFNAQRHLDEFSVKLTQDVLLDPKIIYSDMKVAVEVLNFYGLSNSTKFCIETLKSLTLCEDASDFNPGITPLVELKENTYSEYLAIKDIFIYFDSLVGNKEYTKALSYLKPYANITNQLAWYKYLHLTLLLNQNKKSKANDNLSSFNFQNEKPLEAIKQTSYENQVELEKIYFSLKKDEHSLNPLMMYIYSKVLILKNLNTEAWKILTYLAIHYPYIISAWEDYLPYLSSDCKTIFKLNSHWLHYFILIKYQNMHHFKLSPLIMDKLNLIFKNNFFLIDAEAQSFVNFDLLHEAREKLDYLFSIDPYRYESIINYAHILFMLEMNDVFSQFAFKVFEMDKFRAETNQVIGNFFSYRGDHIKAIKYLERSLYLNDKSSETWLYLGQEYFEVGKLKMSINCFSSALEINPLLHRAWYSMGFIYELNSMNAYALYHFSQALKIKPNESKYWSAVACCYEILNDYKSAISLYEKALTYGTNNNICYFKLAKLYFKELDLEKTIMFCNKIINENIRVQKNEEYCDICLILFKIYFRNGNKEEALKYLKLIDISTIKLSEEDRSLINMADPNIINGTNLLVGISDN